MIEILGVMPADVFVYAETFFDQTKIWEACLKSLGINAVGEVRPPSINQRLRMEQSEKTNDPMLGTIHKWHHDNIMGNGDIDPNSRDGRSKLILWASRNPTEVLMPNGSVFQAEPCQVICFTNSEYKHRTPVLTEEDERSRWFTRSIIYPKTP